MGGQEHPAGFSQQLQTGSGLSLPLGPETQTVYWASALHHCHCSHVFEHMMPNWCHMTAVKDTYTQVYIYFIEH